MAIGDSLALLLKIKADSSQATAEMQKFRKEFKDVESEFKSRGGVLNQVFAGITKEMGLTGSQAAALKNNFTQLATVGGILAGGVTALAGAAVATTIGLFELAKSAADYGSAIFDASQKTGQSAETMSALKYAAEQSGSSLEAISNNVAKFNTLVGLAATGNEKARATLHEYGITATTTDQALIQAIKTIGEMTDSSQQAAAAAALFKDRTGEILPVIKSFDGDLPSLIDKLRDMGLIMSGEDAEAADKFGDQMDTLDKQLQVVKRTLGQELIPVFLDFATKFSGWLAKNKGEVKSWADSIAETFRGLVLQFQQEANDLGAIGDIIDGIVSGDRAGRTGAKLKLRELESQRIIAARANKQPGYVGVNEQPNDLTAGLRPPSLAATDPEAAKKAADEAKKVADERRRLREKEAQEAIASAEKTNQAFLKAERERYATEQEEIERAFLAHETVAQQYRDASVANIKKYSATVKNLIENAFAVDTSQAKNQLDFDAAVAERQTRLSALKRETDKEAADAIKNIEDQRKKAADKAEKDEEKRLDQLEFEKKLRLEIFAAEQAEWEAENNQNIKRQTYLNEVIKNSATPGMAKLVAGTVPQVAEEGFFDSWTGSFKRFYDMVQDLGPTLSADLNSIANVAIDAFGQFANALGQVVQNWVLLGTTGPGVMKKILASALASLAAEAAVRALFELALGFAALFLNPAEAAAHFTAAAIFGSIAGVAAVAGRAIAGNSFKEQAGGGAGASGGRGAGEAPQETRLSERFAGFITEQNQKLDAMIDRQNMMLGHVGEVVGVLGEKIAGMNPGDVVAIGADGASEEIFKAHGKHMSDDLRASTNFDRLQGRY